MNPCSASVRQSGAKSRPVARPGHAGTAKNIANVPLAYSIPKRRLTSARRLRKPRLDSGQDCSNLNRNQIQAFRNEAILGPVLIGGLRRRNAWGRQPDSLWGQQSHTAMASSFRWPCHGRTSITSTRKSSRYSPESPRCGNSHTWAPMAPSIGEQTYQ